MTEGFFLRAESFYNFATYIEQVSDLRAYGGKSLHAQSHGESFLALFDNRFEQGIYILDEPEAALSPQRQLSFLKIIHDLATPATRSSSSRRTRRYPQLPGRRPLQPGRRLDQEIAYRETEHYRVTRDFLNAPERFFKHLFAEEPMGTNETLVRLTQALPRMEAGSATSTRRTRRARSRCRASRSGASRRCGRASCSRRRARSRSSGCRIRRSRTSACPSSSRWRSTLVRHHVRSHVLRRENDTTEATHFHELCHVVQWKALGVRDFLMTYALGLLAHGYRESPLEAIAYRLQRSSRRASLGPTSSRRSRRTPGKCTRGRSSRTEVWPL